MDGIAEAADPATPLARLAEIAQHHPEARVAIAENPSAYPGLLNWLSDLNDPAVDAALRSREQRADQGESQPAALPTVEPTTVDAAGTIPPSGEPFGLIPSGTAQVRSLFRGRRLAALAITIAVTLGAEALNVVIAAAVQQPTASAHGYDFGPTVGAEVLRVPVDEGLDLSDFSLSPTGELQASTSDETITFDPETLQVVRRDPLLPLPPGQDESDTTAFAYSADGAVLYTNNGTSDTLFAIDRDSGRVLDTLEVGGYYISAVAVASETGAIFVSTTEQGEEKPGDLIVIDPGSFHEVARTDIGSYDSIYAVSRDGGAVCLGSSGTVSYDDGAFSSPVLAGSTCYGFGPDGATVLLARDHGFSVADAVTGETMFTIGTQTYDPSAIALSDPSLGFVVVGDRPYATPQYVYRYTADAPRFSTGALVAILVVVDLAVALLGVLVTFLIPLRDHRRRTAPLRRAAAEVARSQRQQWTNEQRRLAEEDAARTAHAQRVGELAKWEAAYGELHPGEPVPAMPVSAASASAVSERMNTLAILALVFGLGGGLLGIIFGHAAHAQIRRTGERGWGLANAGLIFGYLGLITYATLVIFLLANHG